MDLKDYAEKTRETAVYPGQGTIAGLNYAMIGLANEAGEALGKLKKLYRDDDGVLTSSRQEAIIDEMGDVLWYWARACEELKIDPANVAYRNIAKLRDRADRGVIQGSGDTR